MPPLTLNQAAREAGKSKATLLAAIRGGRLSAPKDELGRYQIDPAELFRVYLPPAQRPDMETATDPMPPTTETALLRQKVEFLERILQGIENERNDLRRRLDTESEARENAAAEIHRLTLMLTHSPKIEPKVQPVPTANQNDRPALVRLWLWIALAAVLIGAVFALWLAYSRPLP
ncbi:hypothetical protein BN874_2420015 [Candidatus Contendobacter odensis Run_B_J11]|uniref:Helix-turn-helix domain-containing protein n=2 Tax=Candidatus Contendibacter odensensis TaxID=1400860 RepID=A0A7U7J2V5_9GAMM|nr:hypothetical protein BN874_2420015 [Candidatus Contendobacter odensis Run_B_J11]